MEGIFKLNFIVIGLFLILEITNGYVYMIHEKKIKAIYSDNLRIYYVVRALKRLTIYENNIYYLYYKMIY
jgi:TM2 domain-containing membrane protein YozV